MNSYLQFHLLQLGFYSNYLYSWPISVNQCPMRYTAQTDRWFGTAAPGNQVGSNRNENSLADFARSLPQPSSQGYGQTQNTQQTVFVGNTNDNLGQIDNPHCCI